MLAGGFNALIVTAIRSLRFTLSASGNISNFFKELKCSR